jgi:hypothetical protein
MTGPQAGKVNRSLPTGTDCIPPCTPAAAIPAPPPPVPNCIPPCTPAAAIPAPPPTVPNCIPPCTPAGEIPAASGQAAPPSLG